MLIIISNCFIDSSIGVAHAVENVASVRLDVNRLTSQKLIVRRNKKPVRMQSRYKGKPCCCHMRCGRRHRNYLPPEELQILGVRHANPGIGPRPKRWPALHERQICGIEYQPLAIRTIGERIGAEKTGVRRPEHREIASRQAQRMIINVGDRLKPKPGIRSGSKLADRPNVPTSNEWSPRLY